MNTVARSKTKTLQFSKPTSGIRLDRYLTSVLPKFSRSYVQKLIEQGYILVNEQEAKASQILAKTDRIMVELPPPPTYPLAEQMSLEIIFEDEDILVIDKPAGLTVHPAPGHPSHTLVNAILAHCPNLAMSNDLIRPGIVHRLDKDTSGLIVIAKNELAREYLTGQFKSRTVTKGYLALVKGRLSPKEGVIEGPIGRDPHNRQKMAVVATGKGATTRYKVKEYLGSHTLIEAVPLTGRTHQIRVHFATIGYPVVGDRIYGGKYRDEVLASHLKRQFIHAYLLGFCLPSSKKYQEFTCPLPMDLKQVLESLAREA
jgi:23S rRNA pseudouridine1911/1915/1917 synthase